MISFLDVLLTVIFLLLLALPGFIFSKAKMIPESASETISTIVLYGCQPVLIITSFQGCSFDGEIGLNMLLVAGLGALLHLLMIAVLKFTFIKWQTEDKVKIVKYLSVFSNCGFMGLPFLQSLFSDPQMQAEVLIYCAVIIAVFQILNWTLGIYIITGDKKEVSVKKILFNPVIISILIGFLMFIVIKKPLVELAAVGTVTHKILNKLMGSLNFISNMVTPLSMFVIGIRLANIRFKQLFTDGWAYITSIMKLLVMPLMTMFIVSYLPIASTIKYTLFFLLSMPSATSGVMLAVKFNKDGDFASICVLLSTLLCVLTIPPLYLFMNSVLCIPM